MKNKKIQERSRSVAFAVGIATGLALMAGNTGAYEVPLHRNITQAAYDNSIFHESDVGFRLGLEVPDINANYFPYVPGPGWRYRPSYLIGLGVDEEDDGLRPLNHFYDPANDRALTALSSYKSIDWALAEEDGARDQELGYEQLKADLYEGLTGPQDEYLASIGHFLKGLGHTVHHIQDMAQPEHARVDAHCKEDVCSIIGAYDPSDYEKLTLRAMTDRQINYEGYVATQFGTPREYWHNDANQGMADFSNRNFVTKDTNYRGSLDALQTDPDFALPAASEVVIQSVDVTTLPDFPVDVEGEMQFLHAPIRDENTGSGVSYAHRTSTLSLFAPDLIQRGADPLFTLNKYNYASAASHLIGRATAYSTGFLDQSLRGRMEISLPADGVFAIRDQSQLQSADDGFEKVKARVRNVTLDIERADGTRIEQEMSGGTAVAVVRYRRNDCYEADLSGELNQFYEIPSNCSQADWYYSDQYVSVSEEVDLPDGIPKAGVELTFDFSDDVIPVNARDMVFQVIYRGQLGEEENAIAVSATDISEPTWISLLNMTDLVWIDGRYWSMEDIDNEPELKDELRNLGIDYLPENYVSLVVGFGGRPLATAPRLDAGSYFRLAALTTTARSTMQIYYAYEDDRIVRTSYMSVPGWQLNTTRPPIIYYVPYEVRGTYHGIMQYHVKELSAPPPENTHLYELDEKYDLVNKDPVPMQVDF